MWIIPKNLDVLASVQGMEESSEELNSQELQLEQSLMWRSKPTQLRTWLQRWKRVKWFRLLCGRILKPSQWKNFVDAWTSSLVDSHASRSVVQEAVEQTKTHDICSHTSKDSLSECGRDTSSLKMSQESHQLNFLGVVGPTQQEHPFCSMSSENWKEWVTEQRQDSLQRRKQARLTDVSGGSSMGNWQTPVIMMTGETQESFLARKQRNGYDNRTKVKDLQMQVNLPKNWPTCQARDWKGPQGRAFKGLAKDLPAMVEMKNWAIPRSCSAMAAPVNSEGNQSDKRFPNLETQIGQHLPDQSSTNGKNPESWPTARTSDAEGGRIRPTEMTKEGFRSKRAKSNQWFGAKLRDAVETMEEENWPTPRASKPEGYASQNHSPTLVQTVEGIPRGTDCKGKVSIRLNPNWVEQLMGIPVGWTQLPTEWID